MSASTLQDAAYASHKPSSQARVQKLASHLPESGSNPTCQNKGMQNLFYFLCTLARPPPAVMSSNGETNVVLRGVTHGAVDFLIKPVRVEELRNVWQHVVRRRRESVSSITQTCESARLSRLVR